MKKTSTRRLSGIMSLIRRLPLSRKILLGIVPIFLLFVAVSVAIHNHFQEVEMMEQAQRSAQTYAEIIKESLVSMMVSNYKVDESLLERVNLLDQFDTLHILVNELRLREEIVGKGVAHRLETKHKTLHPHDSLERQVLQAGESIFTRKGDHFRAIVPFRASGTCQKCHAVPIGYSLGAIDLHVSLERISRAAAGNWNRSFWIFIGFSIVVILVATLLFRRYVSTPIETLVKATREISKGNLDYSVSVPGGQPGGNGRSRDELLFLSARFDEMRNSLRDKIGQLDSAYADLSLRNREIEETLEKLRQAQEELVRSERLAVTGRMTAQLSHEINNPIHNIQSLLQTTLRKLNGAAPERELIVVALDEVNRMATLTRQMLEFYRGSVVEIDLEPVDTRRVLEDVVQSNAAALATHGITLHLNVPDGLPRVAGSADKLKQVFLNLILNARDAMPSGGDIHVVATSLRGLLRVTVADTGVGIKPEHLGRIFDAFFTTKKEVSGVGLGLAVTYGIIQQHKGTIEVESSVGKGTVFTLMLPTLREEFNG